MLTRQFSLTHLTQSGFDQMIKNVFLGQGEWFQIFRDIGFSSTDLLVFAIACMNLGLPMRATVPYEAHLA